MALDVSQVIIYISKKINKVYLSGEGVSLERLFALDGVLPILARKASTLAIFSSIRPDVNYVDAPDGLTGEAQSW